MGDIINLVLFEMARATLQIENLPNDFKINLSKLLFRVELGEEIIISNLGVAIALLIPFHLGQ